MSISCEHGLLRRQCALCDAIQENIELRARIAELEALEELTAAGGRDGLAQALTDLCDEIEKHSIHTSISATNIAWFKRKAREALAASRPAKEMLTMTDRELLELAAKAAGLEVVMTQPFIGLQICCGNLWNPLADDGDALRLAVKLGIDICINHEELEVWADDCREPVIHDAGVATRRVIVRAAAEIGRAMP